MTNPSARVVVILNPRAASGRAGRGVDRLRRAADPILGSWDLKLTEAPGHAAHLAREAAKAGAEIVVAAGGDGTIHEVVGGLFDGPTPVRPDVTLGLLPFGTGSDFQKTLEIPGKLEHALQLLRGGETRACDVGLVEIGQGDDQRAEHFINVAGFGANGDVVRRANAMDKRLGGAIVFYRAALQTAFSWSPIDLRVCWRERAGGELHTFEGRTLACFVANAAYCGGGMWVGKGGSLHDGRFDVTLLRPDSATTLVARSWRLYDGSLDRWPGALRFQASEVWAEPLGSASASIDLDGESAGWLPAKFSALPQALRVRGGWAAGA